jgi:hypothetical protein
MSFRKGDLVVSYKYSSQSIFCYRSWTLDELDSLLVPRSQFKTFVIKPEITLIVLRSRARFHYLEKQVYVLHLETGESFYISRYNLRNL